MKILHLLLVLCALSIAAAVPASAQDAVPPANTPAATPAPTLEDILRRQQGLEVDDSARAALIGDPANAAPESGQLGTLGGASDPDLWRALRFDEADVTTQARGPAARTLKTLLAPSARPSVALASPCSQAVGRSWIWSWISSCWAR